jgi:hydroxymethylglutaryl-CoA lyase
VPNERGLERAIECGLRNVATVLSASETHNRKNVNRTRQESLAAMRQVIATAKDEGVAVRSYISTVFGCPYEGPVAIQDSVRLASQLFEAGASEVALGDTTGMGDPVLVQRVVGAMAAAGLPLSRIALHLHDTKGTALANVLSGYLAGIRVFDGSIGGVGGCPYAPGASGNAASEDLAHMFQAMGIETGIDLERASQVGVALADDLGRELPGRYHRFWLGSQARARATRSA